MTELEIVELDVYDAAAFDAWHHVYEVAEQADRGGRRRRPGSSRRCAP